MAWYKYNGVTFYKKEIKPGHAVCSLRCTNRPKTEQCLGSYEGLCIYAMIKNKEIIPIATEPENVFPAIF